MMRLCSLAVLLLPLAVGRAAEPVEADLVIRGATLCDGTGAPAIEGDLAVRGEKIVAVGSFDVAGRPRVIDGKGLIVAPGFIDLHTHSDRSLTLADTRANLCYLTQGVTTVVTGNCGAGPVDVAEYLRTLERGGVGSNVIHQVPHSSLRQAVMGNADRPPTAAELQRMEALVEAGMKAGAYGMATGLIYNPGAYAKTEELIALAKVVARHGGHYASHIRGEGVELLDATAEALRIGREAGLPVHISHMKASGRKVWGKAADSVAMVLEARKAGQPVTADQYPYTASSTSLMATLVPPRFREGSDRDFLARLDDPEVGPRLRAAILDKLAYNDGGASLQIAAYAPRRQWQGKRLTDIAKAEGKQPIDLAVEILRKGGAQIVNFNMSEEDLRLIMRQPFVATASDGSSQDPRSNTVPHPRSYGCFPRKVGRYALEDRVVSLEHAVRSASGLPAEVLQMKDRGLLKAGQYADVVVFDPKTFRDQATFDRPHQLSTGVRYLLVNGKLAIADGKPTGVLAGKALRR